MRIFAHLLFSFFSNIVALYGAAYFVPGFIVSPPVQNFLIAAAALGALNVFIRPIIRALMTPLVWLTLGLGIIAVNMIMLKILDFILSQITIQGLFPLFWSALIVGIVNWIIHLAAEGTYRKTGGD